jgi:uncharacterized protein
MTRRYNYQLEDDIRAAVHSGDITRLKKVLDIENGPPARPDDPGCLFALFVAAYDGNSDIVRLLIGKRINLDAKAPETNWPALDAAAGQGHAEVVRLLLDHGAGVDVRTTGNEATPLIDAATAGHSTVVEMLVEAGADVNARLVSGWTALTCAAFNDKTETVKILLEAGADRGIKNGIGKTALDYASKEYDNSDPSNPDIHRDPRTAELLRSYFPAPGRTAALEKQAPAERATARRLIVPKPERKLKPLSRRNGPPAP